MKRALVLSLAISLALGASNALAVGLGQIQVKSRLNQPLVAEIPVTVDRGSDAESLVVSLASAEEFARIGIERSQIGVPLEFVLVKGGDGKAVIRITSTEPVRSPFLDFLIAANWSNGRVLREYTVLLDPPTTALAVAASPQPAQVQRQLATPPPSDPMREADAQESARTPSSPVEPPAPTVAAAPARTVPEAYRAPQETRQAAAPQQATPPTVTESDGGTYGPVAAGDTLSQIAKANLPGSDVSANQMMVAILNANPQAFSQNNINRLKSGVILRIPSPEEIRAVGSMQTAAAQVRAQNEQWRGEAIEPTLVAGPAASNAGVADFSNATSGTAVDDRLALVPPEMGDDALASTGQAGSSKGTASGNASAADLARSNEELEARNQETGELRSRVKDLEGIQTSNERLISLKDSEIADLQRKLALAQADADAAAQAAIEAPAVVATEPSIDVAPGGENTLETTSPTEAVAATDEVIASESSDAVVTDAAVVDASSESAAEIVADAQSLDSQASTPDAAMAEAPVDVQPEVAPMADSTAVIENPNATDATETLPEDPARDAVVTDTPWYLDPRILGGAALIALLLSALIVRSRRKAIEPVTGKSSLADKFAGPANVPPMLAQSGDGGVAGMDEERQLAQLIAEDPTDLGARLELISIYYADNRVDEFRTAALAMEPYVDDPKEAEWVQVRAMGEDLMPNDPLFKSDAMAQKDNQADTSEDWSDSLEQPIVADSDPVEIVDVETTALMDDPVEAPMLPATAEQPYFATSEDVIVAPVDDADLVDDEADLNDALLASSDDDFDQMDAKASGGLDFTLEDAPELDELTERSAPIAPQGDQQLPTGRLLDDVSMHDRPPTESFDFDDLPPLEFESGFGSPPAATEPTAQLADDGSDDAADDLSNDLSGTDLDDEFLIGEDALGTKLDLARAYAEMGDPDGARSMLEEVLSAGDPEQQERARKLLAELS